MLVQQVVGKLDVRFVNLVDEQHHLCVRRKRLPETSESDIAFDVRYITIAKARIVEALHGVIDVQAIFSLRSGLNVPHQQRLTESPGNVVRQQCLPGARLPFHQERAL